MEREQNAARWLTSPVARQRQSEIFGERERPASELITADLSKYFSGYLASGDREAQPQQGEEQPVASENRHLPPTPAIMRVISPDANTFTQSPDELVTEVGKEEDRTETSSQNAKGADGSAENQSTPKLTRAACKYSGRGGHGLGTMLRETNCRGPASDDHSGAGKNNKKNSTASRQQSQGLMKWIKGEVIGKGSFGTVCLGMNPRSGELLAVKQVELPSETRLAANDDRKRSMLQALQREINLLKNMEHENIVRYMGVLVIR
ncbi:MAG: hypothetical protein BJ554DRAFT_6927, partial [Olpidium bornovanus]